MSKDLKMCWVDENVLKLFFIYVLNNVFWFPSSKDKFYFSNY